MNPVMTRDDTNKYRLFPGTSDQWDDSLKRAAVYHRYTKGKTGVMFLAFAFIEYPVNKRIQAAAEYALSINLPTNITHIEQQLKPCYQCDDMVIYLFGDSRCSKCTRIDPDKQ